MGIFINITKLSGNGIQRLDATCDVVLGDYAKNIDQEKYKLLSNELNK